jgi:hypothetical protein
MRLVPALPLALLALLTAGCGDTKPPPPEPTAKTAGKKRGAQKAAAPKAEVAPGHHVALVEVDGKSVLWMSGRSGTMTLYPAEATWTGGGVAVAEAQGHRVFEADGATWWQPTPPALRPAQTVAAAFEAGGAPPVGYAVTADEVKSGMKRVWVEVADGRRDRLGVFQAAPTRQVWLPATPLSHGGKASPALGPDAGWTTGPDGALVQALPSGATAASGRPVPPELAAQWAADLAAYRGAPVTLTWSTLLDLDQDGLDEGALCLKGGSGDHSCFVAEPLGAERRYFGLQLRFEGGDPGQGPLAFQRDGGTYLMRAGGGQANGNAALLVRYDGQSYTSEPITPPGAAAAPPAPRTAAGRKGAGTPGAPAGTPAPP